MLNPKYADIDTSLDHFTYWLEEWRPFPQWNRWWTYGFSDDDSIPHKRHLTRVISQFDRYSRVWQLMYPFEKHRSWGEGFWPLTNIHAAEVFPNKVTVYLSQNLGIVPDEVSDSALKGIADWVHWRFGVEVKDVSGEEGRESLAPAILAGLPSTPPRLDDGYARDDVCDWWYRGGRLFYPKLQDMADHLGFAPKTIHNWHSNYKKEYGDAPMPNDKSRFAGKGISGKSLPGTE